MRKESTESRNLEVSVDLEQNIDHKNQAFMNKQMSGNFQQQMDIIGGSREKSHSIYIRNQEEEHINLEDFHLVSVIGRGNFGKVYLVYLPQKNEYYAMKSIRKDIVLDNDSLENIKLEKLILL